MNLSARDISFSSEARWSTEGEELNLKELKKLVTLARNFSAFFLPKSKKTQKRKTCRSSMQSFVILGSLLQWRWLRASIGHFVFLLFSNLKLPNNNHVCSSFQGLWCNLWSIIKCFPMLQNYFSCQSKIFVKKKTNFLTLVSDISRLLMDAATCDQLSKVFQHFKCFSILWTDFSFESRNFSENNHQLCFWQEASTDW